MFLAKFYAKVVLLLPKGSFLCWNVMHKIIIILCKFCAGKRVHLFIIKKKSWFNWRF